MRARGCAALGVPMRRNRSTDASTCAPSRPPAVDIANVKMSMNPFCEIAVEEAVRLKEKKVADEVRRLRRVRAGAFGRV